MDFRGGLLAPTPPGEDFGWALLDVFDRGQTGHHRPSSGVKHRRNYACRSVSGSLAGHQPANRTIGRQEDLLPA